jgi:perosamine synthetase
VSWPTFTPQCRKDVDRVLRSGRLTAYKANGKRLEPETWSQAYALEREMEKAFKVKHAVACSSGTAALHASLGAALAKRRAGATEVITSPYTFSATASAILLAGLEPRFADVDPHTFCITKETVKPHVTKKTAAILHVNLFGYFPDLSGLVSLGLPVIEDSCQAVGASRGGSYAGTVGVAGTYSFNGSKNIPAGEGGCLVTNSDKVAEKARLLVNHGENFGSTQVGLNYRMHEVVACIARHGLKSLEERNQRRRDLAYACFEALTGVGFWDTQITTWTMAGPNVYYVAPFKVLKNRSRFISRCAKRGLPIQASYTTPLHHLKAFRKYTARELPVVDELHKKTLCLLTTLTPDRSLSYARKAAGIIRESLEEKKRMPGLYEPWY